MAEGSGQAASEERPFRVAIVGSGPAGFYAADALLKSKAPLVAVDMFERLPVPFGLVRFGVAPDHQRIKRASAAFERTAASERFRFFGNVELGSHLTLDELFVHYDQVLLAIGSATDRRLGIPGEDLHGSHAATRFVGWYNGHPDFTADRFDLATERAVVVGVGNVAMDVARMLVRSPDELATTDIAGYALEALRRSRIKEVVLLGRRSPAQAAFDAGELKDIAELPGVGVSVDPEQVMPEFPGEGGLAPAARQSLALLRKLAEQPKTDAARRVVLRFLTSPNEIVGVDGRVTALRIEHNAIEVAADGEVKARGTGRLETIDVGLVFRSIGYRGVPLSGIPFDDRAGTIPNQAGRVTETAGGALVPGLYVTGWIKRGPTGLIGTNKPDAQETVSQMLADAPGLDRRTTTEPNDIVKLLTARNVRVVTFLDWRTLDQLELAAGKKLGKVREKFCSCDEMLSALLAAEAAGNDPGRV